MQSTLRGASQPSASDAPTQCGPRPLAVVVVNFQTAEMTCDCLSALAAEAASNIELKAIVVDNASANAEAELIERAIAAQGWSDWARVVRSPVNGGFSAGNNLGVGSIDADLYLLLNPDTRVRPGAVRALVEFMDDRPDVAVAGARLEDDTGVPHRSAFRYPGVISELLEGLRLGIVWGLFARWVVAPPCRTEPHQAEWVSGACMLVRRAALKSVSGFDEQFFLYFEEVDLCRRIRNCGWQCWYVPESRVVHLVGGVTGLNDAGLSRLRRPRYWFESRRRFFVKHYGPARALLADLARIGGVLLWTVRRKIQRKPDCNPPCFLVDLLRNSVFCKGFRL